MPSSILPNVPPNPNDAANGYPLRDDVFPTHCFRTLSERSWLLATIIIAKCRSEVKPYYPICGMQIGAPCQRALPAPKTTRRISKEKTREPDVYGIFPQSGFVRFHASAHRNAGAERDHRHASAHRGSVAVQGVGYLSGITLRLADFAARNRKQRKRIRSVDPSLVCCCFAGAGAALGIDDRDARAGGRVQRAVKVLLASRIRRGEVPCRHGKSIDFVAGGEVNPTASDDAGVPPARIGH